MSTYWLIVRRFLRNKDLPLKDRFPRLFTLQLDKGVSIAVKLNQDSWFSYFRRHFLGGAESEQA